MGRSPCCDESGLKKGPWTTEEDQKLVDYIRKNGYGNWRTLPKNAGLERCGKSCRLRWTNYLRPDIKRGRFSFEEEETIIQLHSVLGNKWSTIAARLPGRTDNEIKNYWNTHIRKRLLKMGIDPVTHNPRLDLLDFSSILNSSIYNSSQMDVSRLLGNVQPLINPEFLRLASSILSSGYLNSNLQSGTITPQMPQLVQPSEYQGFETCEPFSSEAQVSEANVDQQYLRDLSNITPQENFPCDDINVLNDLVHVENYGSWIQNWDQEFNFPSVMSNLSTASSSPTLNSNSNTTYMTEDERELSYCSSMLKLEIPDIWDASGFV